MKAIRRSSRADADIDDIWLHIAQDDIEAATRTVETIAAATARLSHYPLSGRARPELGPAVRSLPVGRYVVLHRAEAGHVLILRVLHAARDLGAALDDNG